MEFKEFKKEVLAILDKEIGFFQGMEIDELDNFGIEMSLNGEPIIINNRNNTTVKVFSDKIISCYKTVMLNKKIAEAINLISEAYKRHGHQLFIGYSGGKDSKVIQHLAHLVSKNIISVHNSCATETNDYFGNVIVIKEPKSNFQSFLPLTDFKAQIDGTRKCEDGKNVIFNGKEITRDELNDTYIAYSGSATGKSGDASSFLTKNADYVRIDGPSVWIEFICQNGVVYREGIHYHSVFRDHKRDYNGL